MSMAERFGEFINVLKPGDVFRDWLIDVVGDKVHDKRCKVLVYRYFSITYRLPVRVQGRTLRRLCQVL